MTITPPIIPIVNKKLLILANSCSIVSKPIIVGGGKAADTGNPARNKAGMKYLSLLITAV